MSRFLIFFVVRVLLIMSQVEWSEINSAWGQTLLLLYSIAKKMKFEFKDYKLVPQGR